MKLFKSIIFYTIAGLILFNMISCKKDETLRYGNVTMGNRVNGKFISDQGNTFNLVEINAKINFDKFRRGIMQCDVLRQTGEKEYDVRVTYLDTVLTKAPVMASAIAEDSDKKVQDPIHIEQYWVSGGYLNMYVVFEIQIDPMLKDSKHMVNIVLDESASTEGTYTFALHHNAFGETFKQKETTETVPEVSTMSDDSVSWGFSTAKTHSSTHRFISRQRQLHRSDKHKHQNIGKHLQPPFGGIVGVFWCLRHIREVTEAGDLFKIAHGHHILLADGHTLRSSVTAYECSAHDF